MQKHKLSSKFIGVSWCKSRGKWFSYVNINGKKKYVGSFRTELEAFEARWKFKKQIKESKKVK